MEIKVKTSYEIGQSVDEMGLKGKIMRIEIIVYSENHQMIDYILDNGGKISMGWKSPEA